MNRYKLSKAGIDANEGIARFGGNVEIYEKFLNRFPDEPYFRLMCEAIERLDIQAAFAAAHSIKGAVGNLSMNRLYGDLCPLVEELRRGSAENLAELLVPVMKDYEDIIAALS